MVEEVLVPVELGQLNSDLYSSVVWSRVGLVNFKNYKKQVFSEFEERELEFFRKYPKVTPFANEQIEMEYTKQVQFVGEEEEFNLESFTLFNQEEETKTIEDLVVPQEVLHHYEDLEEIIEEPEEYIEEVDFDSLGSSRFEFIPQEDDVEEVLEDVQEDIFPLNLHKEVKRGVGSLPHEEDSSLEELLGSNTEYAPTKPVQKPKVRQNTISQEPKVAEERGIVYFNGMSLRQFLRENPRSSIDVAEKYFSRKEIMKEVQLGRVIKRGKKLFI